jgi:hypothetical protein
MSAVARRETRARADLPQLGSGHVENARRDDPVGRDEIDVDQVRALARRRREVLLDLARGDPGGHEVDGVGALLGGWGLHQEAAERGLHPGSDRRARERGSVQGAQLRGLAGGVVDQIEAPILGARLDADVPEEIRTDPIRRRGLEAKPQRIDDRSGDRRRAEDLDLGLDRIDEDVDPGDATGRHQTPSRLGRVVDLQGGVRLVVDPLSRDGPDRRSGRDAEDEQHQPEATGDHLPVVGQVRRASDAPLGRGRVGVRAQALGSLTHLFPKGSGG